MRKKYCRVVLFLICLWGITLTTYSQDISLEARGFYDARDGVDRYEMLYCTHQEALRLGVNVVYRGADTIEIVIPKGAKPIPLTSHNDFRGTHFVVLNQQSSIALFEKIEPLR